MTDELTLKILREIAEPGSGHRFSRREAARHAVALIEQQAARIAALETKCRLYEASLDKSDERIAELEAQTLSPELRAALGVIDDKLRFETDCGPRDEGWRSDELIAAWEVIDAAIAASDAHDPAQPQQDTKE